MDSTVYRHQHLAEDERCRVPLLRPYLQLRRRLRMVPLRLAVAPEPFCSAMLRRLLYTPRTVKAAGCISIV